MSSRSGLPVSCNPKNPLRPQARSDHLPRKDPMATDELTLPALAIRQSSDRTLYSFAVDGKQLPRFAAVSRVHRTDRQQLDGYQRAESIAHVKTIRKYLESDDAILPNALVVAFDSRVRFEVDGGPDESGVRVGRLVIPVDDD